MLNVRAATQRTCVCGSPVEWYRWREGKTDCLDCGMYRLLTHNVQMARKEGPGYEKWLAGIVKRSQSPAE